MRMTEKRSELLGETYFYAEHESGLPIYVFPKELTTTYAILSARYGSVDRAFRKKGEREWITPPAGVAHFLEHKLFENEDGSDSFEVFSALGADANAYTACNRTAYLFSCTEQFDEALSELLRFVFSPYFTEQTVKKEQGIIAQEIRMYDDNPWERCFQNLMEGMYHTHPVRESICGSEASIARITDQILYECHSAFYQPENMALVVCGRVTAEQVLRIADEALPKKWEKTEIERYHCAEPRGVRASFTEARMQVSKPIFSIGIKDTNIPSNPAERMRRDAAMSLLEEILFSRAGDFYSTLFEEGLITASYSYGYSIAADFAFHTVSGESDCPKEILRRLREYLKRVQKEGIAEDAFERCRRVLYADEIRGYDSTEEISNNLLTFVFDEADLFAYPEVLMSIRREELPALLGELLEKDAFCLSAVYPLNTQKGEER